MKKQVYLLVECTDYDTIYRVLLFDDNLDKRKIQEEIYRIKQHFYDEDYDGWSVDDVLEELSKIYDFEDLGGYHYLEV